MLVPVHCGSTVRTCVVAVCHVLASLMKHQNILKFHVDVELNISKGEFIKSNGQIDDKAEEFVNLQWRIN